MYRYRVLRHDSFETFMCLPLCGAFEMGELCKPTPGVAMYPAFAFRRIDNRSQCDREGGRRVKPQPENPFARQFAIRKTTERGFNWNAKGEVDATIGGYPNRVNVEMEGLG